MKRTLVFNLTGLLFILFTLTCRAGGFNHSGGIAYFKVCSEKGVMEEINAPDLPFVLTAKAISPEITDQLIFIRTIGRDSISVQFTTNPFSRMYSYTDSFQADISNQYFTMQIHRPDSFNKKKALCGYLIKFLDSSKIEYCGNLILGRDSIVYYVQNDDQKTFRKINSNVPFDLHVGNKHVDILDVPIYLTIRSNATFELNFSKNGKDYVYKGSFHQQIETPYFSFNLSISGPVTGDDFKRNYYFKIER